MLDIPQYTYYKYGKIENGVIICDKRQQIPRKIENGSGTCEYHLHERKGLS